MFAALLVASALATSPEPPAEPEPVHHVRRVRAPVIAAAFGGAVLGSAASVGLSFALDVNASDAVVTFPVFTVAGASLPTALMTDGRSGYITLGASIGLASGVVVGIGVVGGLTELGSPGNGLGTIVAGGMGGVVVGALGAATGALIAANMDIRNQERNQWALSPVYSPRDGTAGLVFSGRF